LGGGGSLSLESRRKRRAPSLTAAVKEPGLPSSAPVWLPAPVCPRRTCDTGSQSTVAARRASPARATEDDGRAASRKSACQGGVSRSLREAARERREARRGLALLRGAPRCLLRLPDLAQQHLRRRRTRAHTISCLIARRRLSRRTHATTGAETRHTSISTRLATAGARSEGGPRSISSVTTSSTASAAQHPAAAPPSCTRNRRTKTDTSRAPSWARQPSGSTWSARGKPS